MKIKNFSPLLFIFLTACSTAFQENSSGHQEAQGITVPKGFTAELVAGADLVDFPMFAMADETGRLFVFESTGNVYKESQDAIDDPQFRIKLLTDLNGDGSSRKSILWQFFLEAFVLSVFSILISFGLLLPGFEP